MLKISKNDGSIQNCKKCVGKKYFIYHFYFFSVPPSFINKICNKKQPKQTEAPDRSRRKLGKTLTVRGISRPSHGAIYSSNSLSSKR